MCIRDSTSCGDTWHDIAKSICRKWSYQYDDDIPDNLSLIHISTIWMIPKDAEKPADRRFKNTKK